MKNIINNYKKNEYILNETAMKEAQFLEQIPLLETFLESAYHSVNKIVNEKNAHNIMKIFINSSNDLRYFEQKKLRLLFLLIKKVIFDKREIELNDTNINDIKEYLKSIILTFSLEETLDFLDYFLIIHHCESSIHSSDFRNCLTMYVADEVKRIRKIPELLDYLDKEKAVEYLMKADPYLEIIDLLDKQKQSSIEV